MAAPLRDHPHLRRPSPAKSGSICRAPALKTPCRVMSTPRLRRALGAAGRGSASSRAEELCPALPALLVALAVVRVAGGRVLAGQREAAPRRRGLWPKPRPVSSVATRRRAQC